eukprot:m.558975 g.558975  ORF g.558975 m.558975 type:complete len:323 (-) comp22203_c0_seq2:1080-2048(-)
MATSKIVRIALDWTPNTNHTGMYVANANKWYEAAGLEVKFVVPTENSTPARMLAAGEVEIAIAPSESAISFATTDTKNTIAAVAAILQRSTSAICTLQSSGIASPKGLENKRYASYSGRFEDCIVQQMVKNDGGDGSKVQFHGLEGHGYGDDIQESSSVVATYLKTGKSDSTWIFKHWEGILAGTDTLNYFDLEHYKVPYGYSPVMLVMIPGTSSANDAAWLARFLEATARGYVFADAHPDEAARYVNLFVCGCMFGCGYMCGCWWVGGADVFCIRVLHHSNEQECMIRIIWPTTRLVCTITVFCSCSYQTLQMTLQLFLAG